VAADTGLSLARLTQRAPSAPFHSGSVIQAANVVNDRLGFGGPCLHSIPAGSFADICEVDAPVIHRRKLRNC